MLRLRSLLMTPPGGAVILLEEKLAVISAGGPSRGRLTFGEEEPTAWTFIRVLAWLPRSARSEDGETWRTKVSPGPVMVKNFITDLSFGGAPTRNLTG